MATLANKSEANQMAFGQHGCVLIDNDTDIFIPPDGKVVVSIQCLGDTTFDLLVAEDSNRFISTEASSHSTGVMGTASDGGTAAFGAGFIDTTGTPASTLIGKSLYLKSTGAFLAKVKAVGFAADGSVDASALELDRIVTIANSAVLAVTDSDEGFGGVTIATANVFPKGITIHGRWTVVSLAANQTTDGAILYLGPGNYHPE
tara:strand:+ start:1167 stop:1775 length:609 start_codon:yes stop_codon:yes gene_type:complete